MKRTLRLLAVIGALGTGALGLSACDASPYAAAVNGQVIKEVALNNQLKAWTANQTWVKSFDSANSTANGGTGTTVTGAGGPGTYSAAFVADILDNMIQVSIVHQHLQSTGKLPSADTVVASRAVNEYLRSGYWTGFSPSLRDFLTEQLADQAPLTPVAAASTLQSPYSQIEPYLFSQLCVEQSTATDQASAAAIAASGQFQGADICYDQASLEAQPQAYRDAVLKLTVGRIAPPIKAAFGYDVVKLTSRQAPGFTEGVKQVLSVATASSLPQTVSSLYTSARVKVNPTYGTWSNGQLNPPTLNGS